MASKEVRKMKKKSAAAINGTSDEMPWEHPLNNNNHVYAKHITASHRTSYRKAIQKAGYSMNDLAVSGSTPASSPMVTRRIQQKCEVDWTENASVSDHIWSASNASGDLCYVGDESCTKTGIRKKCAACRIVVHEQCIEQLNKIGFQCKTTFREVAFRSSRENIIVRHHWVHRRKQEGKCKQCSRSFERRFGFRDSKIIAISCSWCKEAYHNKVSCFQMHKISEPCNMGVHGRLIVPPNWILKHTQRQKSTRTRSKKKRNSGNFTRKRSSTFRDGRNKPFSIRPLLEHTPYLHPTIVFINPKSGGNQGAKLMQNFQWLLNPRQVFDLSKGGPREALEMFRKVPNLRILACGGDGTVGWILSVLDELNYPKPPPVAVLPLGTGNDLSRTLNWGPGYSDEPITKILQHVEEGKVVQLDRWKLTVTPNRDATKQQRSQEEDQDSGNTTTIPESNGDGVDQPPIHVVNNYFSIGTDAQVSWQFHQSREAHPGKFNSRFGNKFFYARAGVTNYLNRQTPPIHKNIQLVCDDQDISHKIREVKPACLLFLNILKYSAGTEPWGKQASSEFKRPCHDDKLIEVLAFTPNQLGMLFVGGHGERLCQCRHAEITTNLVFPVQIDGEPCQLNPSNITLSFLNQANVICKTKRPMLAPIPDSVSEKQKIWINSISLHKYELYNGDKDKLTKLSHPVISAMVPSTADLKTTRLAIEDMLGKSEAKGVCMLSQNWSFLDLGGGDRFFQIDSSQETLHPVANIAYGGLIFVLDLSSNQRTLKAERSESNEKISKEQKKPTSPRLRIYSDSKLTTMVKNEATKIKPALVESGDSSIKLQGTGHSLDSGTSSLRPTRLYAFKSVDETRHKQTLLSVTDDNEDTADISFSASTHCDENIALSTVKTTKSPESATTVTEPSLEVKNGASEKQVVVPRKKSGDTESIVCQKPSSKTALAKSKSDTNSEQFSLSKFVSNSEGNPQTLSKFVENISNGVVTKNMECKQPAVKPTPKKLSNSSNIDDAQLPTETFNLSLNQNHSNNQNEVQIQKWTKELLNASKRGDVIKVKVALDNGASATALDFDGCSVMHNAARFNHAHIVEYLLERGLRNLIRLPDKSRMQTPLHKAAWFGNFNICKILVDAGSSLTVTDYKGMTPHGRAVQAEDTKLVEYLMQESCKQNQISQRETDL